MDHSLSNSIEPTEENFPGGLNEDGQESLVHLSKEEARVYDVLQGGPHLDEELEIRSYKPLGELLKHKDFQELVLSILREEKESFGNAPELHEAMQTGEDLIKREEKPFEAAPGDSNPMIMELSEKGKGSGAGKDTLVVMMPGNVLFLMGLIKGEIPINPSTGFPQFGVFKSIGRAFSGAGNAIGRVGGAFGVSKNVTNSILRVGTTIAGAVMGGPVGAMAGSALGSATTGRRTKDWLVPGITAGGLTAGAQFAAPYLGAPGAHLGNAVGTGWLGNAGSAAGASSAMAGSPNVAGQTMGQMAAQGAPQAAAAAPSMFHNIMSNPMIHMAPAALNIGAAHMANKGAREQYANEVKDRDRSIKEDRELLEDLKQKNGFYENYEDKRKKKTVNPKWQEAGQPYFLHEGDSDYKDATELSHYSRGGIVKKKTVPLRKGLLIKGPGRGQDDLIHTNSEEGAFILDASTVSNLGDGSSEAGAERVTEFLRELNRKLMPEAERRHSRLQDMKFGSKVIPVALSRDEIYLNPENVKKIGLGDHKEGVQKLNEFVKNIREHKSSNGDKLPPKSKNIEEYMRG
jgi:hypothetical protein